MPVVYKPMERIPSSSTEAHALCFKLLEKKKVMDLWFY